MKKLLLPGSNTIHTFSFFHLIEDYFDEIALITDITTDFHTPKLTAKHVVDSSLKNPFNYGKAIKKYQNILEKEKPALIHIQQISTYSFLLIKALRITGLDIPVIVTAWGSDVLLTPKKGYLYKEMVKYVLMQGNEFTADAQYVADEMQKLVKKRLLSTTIANFGINVEEIHVQKENIVYSNRLHKSLYRIDKIIIAFSKFLKQNPEWRLVVAAIGSDTEKLKQLCKNLIIESEVEFLGWVDAKINFENYAKAKIWVSIPHSDATSISLLEAMSMGCIPVVSNLPANREWITHNNGIIVDCVDDNFFEHFSEIDYNTAVLINKKLIADRGTKEVNRQKFIEIYKKLLH
jgi:glycosyltransferase involved in cell wall biosynthesis